MELMELEEQSLAHLLIRVSTFQHQKVNYSFEHIERYK
jgi:hypothetical protein